MFRLKSCHQSSLRPCHGRSQKVSLCAFIRTAFKTVTMTSTIAWTPELYPAPPPGLDPALRPGGHYILDSPCTRTALTDVYTFEAVQVITPTHVECWQLDLDLEMCLYFSYLGSGEFNPDSFCRLFGKLVSPLSL